MPTDEEKNDPAYARRSFFRRMFVKGFDQAEAVVRDNVRKVTNIVKLPKPAYVPPEPYEWKEPARLLRPPGAIPELEFAETCSRCGDCVRACPAQCIVLDKDEAGGLPHIKARQSPCVVCDDLSCMKACPTGALQEVDRKDIRMGYAIVDHSRCLRGEMGEYNPDTGEVSVRGEDCRICVQMCPYGDKAIGLDQYHGTVEIREGCVGCGVCERVCPTEPASVWVEPIEPVIDFPLYRD